VMGRRVMLTATREPRVDPSTAGRIAHLGRLCHPGAPHRFLESCRGGSVVALVTASRCLMHRPGQILRRNSCIGECICL
jgi:hypothetical protein